jgi:hypothetical protein
MFIKMSDNFKKLPSSTEDVVDAADIVGREEGPRYTVPIDEGS